MYIDAKVGEQGWINTPRRVDHTYQYDENVTFILTACWPDQDSETLDNTD